MIILFMAGAFYYYGKADGVAVVWLAAFAIIVEIKQLKHDLDR